MAEDAANAEISGVRLTHPDKVLYPEQGITKRELAEYYEAVEEWILPHLAGRPLSLVRCPAGQEKECFFQRRASEHFPRSVRRVEVPEAGGSATYLVADTLPALLYLVQIGVLELHTWGARRDRLDRPDRVVFDLDPDASLPWARVVEAAREVRERLDALGLRSWVKTTGGKGLHVVAPLLRRHTWDEVRAFAHAFAERMAEDAPDRYLLQAAKAERTGKIFVDYLRNGWSASVIAAYSTRARPGAPVSVPLGWEELNDSVRPDTLTVRTIPSRLNALGTDPWAEYARTRQGITRTTRATLGLE